MKKLSKEVNCTEDNKIVSVIGDLIDGRLSGDWNEYRKGEIVKYEFDYENDEDEIEFLDEEFNIKSDKLKEFIDKGICYIVDEKIWYNIKFENNKMIVKYECVDIF